MSQSLPKPKALSLPKPAPLGSLLNTSTSDASTKSGRPSLLAGLTIPPHGNHDIMDEIAPPRPRRLWKVNDTSLRPVPFFYPPLDPRCTVFVSDAPPSVVAVRIAECLRKRSISVEYDEDAVTANAMTVDRCHFVVNMFQGSSGGTGADGKAKPDFSHGVIVECLRIRGDAMSFHHACRAVLQSALSHSSGEDNRRPQQTACQDFPRLTNLEKRKNRTMNLLPRKKSRRESFSSEAMESLEHAHSLLKKDRLGPQKVGMEVLVNLTDVETCGLDTALQCSLAVLGAPTGAEEEPSFLEHLHYNWIVQLLQDRTWPGEFKDFSNDVPQQTESTSMLAACNPFLGEDCNPRVENDHDLTAPLTPTTKASWTGVSGIEEYHGGILRALCLRVFANALAVVAMKQSDMLKSILQVQCKHLVSKDFLAALVDDLAGAIRPPAVVEGTRLSSVHEAALAIRCLGILGEHSDVAHKFLLSDSVLESLEKARAAGRSTHEVLASEAERTYSRLTEDARSC